MSNRNNFTIFDFLTFCYEHNFIFDSSSYTPRYFYRFKIPMKDKTLCMITFYDDTNMLVIDYKRNGAIYRINKESDLVQALCAYCVF